MKEASYKFELFSLIIAAVLTKCSFFQVVAMSIYVGTYW